MKNGKGIIRDVGINEKKEGIYIEREYLNGEGNGKGKVYNGDGVLMFKGEYLNNKRNGKGKEYNGKGKLTLMVNIWMIIE